MRRNSWCYAIIAILLSVSTAKAQFTFQGIGGAPAPTLISVANGISGDGRVVIGSNSVQAARWTPSTGLVRLGTGTVRSNGFAASTDGSILVGDGNGGQEAFRWTAGTGMVGLGFLPGNGSSFSAAMGVSGDGNVVVGFSKDNIAFHAFRWTAATGMTPLGSLGGTDKFGVANGISSDGNVIVGEGDTATGVTEAFRWTAATGMVGLGVLPGSLNGGLSTANAASADGNVIVGFSTSAFGEQAFRWTPQGGMVGLGDLPGVTPFSSTATAVSADGNVIVGFGNGTGEFDSGTAFLWLPSLGVVDLKSFLLQHGVQAVSNWTLNFAKGISADGRTIVGEGIDPQGLAEGWVAHIDLGTVAPASETIKPSAFSVLAGTLAGGGLKQLQTVDGHYLILTSMGVNPMQMTVDGQASQASASELDFSLVASAHESTTRQAIELFDFTTATWVLLDSRVAPSVDTATVVKVTDRPARFVDPQTLHVRARLTYLPSAKKNLGTRIHIDQAFWTRTP